LAKNKKYNRVLVTAICEDSLQKSKKRMKRIDGLFDKICSVENLMLADEKARRGKKNTYGVKMHDKNREQNIINLHHKLILGEYRTSQYNIFKIYEPKEREIYRLPYYPDRIVHHAVMNVLEPIWLSIFTTDTYSCIKGRGIHAAAKSISTDLHYNQEDTMYCLKLDIKKYYPSIKHDILKDIIRKKIKDKKLLNLLDEIIDSAPGLPIGNYLSQYLANLYLAYFDHKVKEEKNVRFYYRYADDIVILSADKNTLHSLISFIKQEFEMLGLQVKSNYQIFPVESRGIDFVGYVFFHDHTLLRNRIKKSFCKRIHSISRTNKEYSNKEIKMLLSPWLGWAKYCNSRNLIKKLSKKINHEIIIGHKALHAA
jgi:RNA-directed DNA polymerase